MCEAFGCSPSVAEEEYARDPVLIHGIFDHRNAKATIDLIKSGDAGAKVIEKNPQLMRIIDVLRQAQGG